MRITRVEMMIEICKIVGLRGTCPRAKVGCVIERDGRILVTGYNGSLPGEPHCEDTGCVMVDGHCSTAVHAEENAIAFAAKHGIRIDGANLYTTGWAKGCCPKCTRLAMSAGINEIITEWRPNEDSGTDVAGV